MKGFVTLLIEQYEKEHYSISDPDPIEAMHFRMNQLGLRQKDLEEFIGQKSKVSEVMNRKRPLSLPMIRLLSIHLGIPAAVLVRETPLSLGKTASPAARKRKPAAAS